MELSLIRSGDDPHLWVHEYGSSPDGPDACTHGHRFQAGGRSISTPGRQMSTKAHPCRSRLSLPPYRRPECLHFFCAGSTCPTWVWRSAGAGPHDHCNRFHADGKPSRAIADQRQEDPLAFSSIAHMGYLLVALLAGGPLGAAAATYYLIAYAATILAAFGVMTVLSGPRYEAASIDDYRGLFSKRPLVAGSGCIHHDASFHLPESRSQRDSSVKVLRHRGRRFAIAMGTSFTLVASSTIGLFYYLRIIVAMYSQPGAPDHEGEPSTLSWPLPATLALAVLTGLIFLLGVYPVPLWGRYPCCHTRPRVISEGSG